MKISQMAFGLAKSKLGELIVGTTFEHFSSLLPVKKISENEFVLAFYHPKPFWEEHVLIVPKKKIRGLPNIDNSNAVYVSEMHKMAAAVIKKLEWEKAGYSTLINGGTRQEIAQLHMHLFKGKELV